MGEPLQIAFFGSSLVSAYWNGAATYYRGILSAMHARGHTITFYEPDAFERQQHRDIEDPDYAQVIVYSPDEVTVRAMVARARNADLIVKASGVGVFDDLLEEAVLELQSPARRVVFWDVDAPATLDRAQRDPDDKFRALIPEYDLILTYGGGLPVVQAYERLGARRCIPVYNALDPRTHYPAERDSRFECDLAFLGNRMPDREERVREFFFRTAALLPHATFLLGGNGWDPPRADSNIRYLQHVFTRDHNALNSTAHAILNVSRESMARYGFSPATRVFEAAGAGACIITDAWEGIELFLTPGAECLVARDGAEVADYVLTLTHHERRRIGRAARERILAEHTYGHRARQLEQILHAAPAAAGELVP